MHCDCGWGRRWEGAAELCETRQNGTLMNAGRRWLACFLLLLVSACVSNPINCDLIVDAQVPLEVHNRLLVVPAGINGRWVKLLVDTGAERTVLSSDVVERLGLERDDKTITVSTGVGGT